MRKLLITEKEEKDKYALWKDKGRWKNKKKGGMHIGYLGFIIVILTAPCPNSHVLSPADVNV